MKAHRSPSILITLLAIASVAAACGGGTGPIGPVRWLSCAKRLLYDALMARTTHHYQ